MNQNYTINVSDSTVRSGQLARLNINHPRAQAEVFLQGAHVTHWQPEGFDPVLFVSGRSKFSPGVPIRGGVPICFPWFATHATDPALPAHGFVRTREWDLVSANENEAGVSLHFQTGSDEASHELWESDFLADFRVSIGRTLEMRLTISNTGETPIKFEEALHTYFRISDIHDIAVTGLQGVTYLDKPANMRRVVEEADEIRFTAETDRVYLNTPHPCTIEDPGMKRRIVIEKSNSASTVVWNPFDAKAAKAPDIGSDNWRGFVCVETANCQDNVISLEPGRSHEMAVKLHVERLEL
ncbi:MAG: D-hexose-6-phosphate mutarotase [Burkholderiales bacterium]|nr:D-hexose-6-phosphate mutarotase [Phycisphaerae bacterium]